MNVIEGGTLAGLEFLFLWDGDGVIHTSLYRVTTKAL